jgi:hypothetical protein
MQKLASNYGLKPSGKQFLVRKLKEIWNVLNSSETPCVSQTFPESPGRRITNKSEIFEFIKNDAELYKKILRYDVL